MSRHELDKRFEAAVNRALSAIDRAANVPESAPNAEFGVAAFRAVIEALSLHVDCVEVAYDKGLSEADLLAATMHKWLTPAVLSFQLGVEDAKRERAKDN